MDPNPYESPKSVDPQLNQSTTDQPAGASKMKLGRLLFAIGWTALLFLSLPAVQQIPLFSRLLSSAITLVALAAMFTTFGGWRRYLLVPVALLLLFLQYQVWLFPFPGR